MYSYNMSENGIGSNGDAPTPEQYRRRRIVAGAAAALVLLLLIWGMVSLVRAIGGSGNSEAEVAATSTTSAPFSDFSERASESADASKSASAEASESAEATDEASESASTSEEPTADKSAAETTEAAEETASAEASDTPEATPSATESTQAAPVACTAADLQVSLTADQQSYAAGANPALAITYTNASENPCLVGGDVKSIDINITSGPAQVYNSSTCQQEAQAETELAAGKTETTVMTWDRQLNVLGCGSTTKAQPGYYWATATVNGVSSQPTRIIITG